MLGFSHTEHQQIVYGKSLVSYKPKFQICDCSFIFLGGAQGCIQAVWSYICCGEKLNTDMFDDGAIILGKPAEVE